MGNRLLHGNGCPILGTINVQGRLRLGKHRHQLTELQIDGKVSCQVPPHESPSRHAARSKRGAPFVALHRLWVAFWVQQRQAG